MGEIGELRTKEPIEKAIREINGWLSRIGITGLSIDTRYDAASNVALLRFDYSGKHYEFRSTKQQNCRLNMWAIARVMEYKTRSHLMNIEPFEKSMQAYLQLGAPENYQASPGQPSADYDAYATLGISPLSSNEELLRHYKKLAKAWHPDMAGSDEAKSVFEKKITEINDAWVRIKQQRNL